ncbi:hypothetical protein EWM64_g1778 [Hericium alpestre]|uniref:Uncharacterized protein n=1 Tax=Hericium alpestre TaxID=135208 RepID=A0A4Z0A7F3_9AGAM|nr:hypothetical protein EWM64_g1778 [Hericium alpestre]
MPPSPQSHYKITRFYTVATIARHHPHLQYARGGIPPQYLIYPDKSHCDPPRFHFGVGVTYRQLYDYSV